MGVDVEEVQRYEPIGYQTSKKLMLKVIAIDPKEIRSLRERVKKINGIEEVFETDILFKNRFMIDKNLGGMKWAEVPNQEEFTESEIKSLEIKENVPLRLMSIDIECLPKQNGAMPTSLEDPIILTSLAFSEAYNEATNLVLVGKLTSQSSENTLSFANESELLENLMLIIEDYDPDIIVGYNSNEFDFPYIENRTKKLGIRASIGRDGSSLYTKKIVLNTNVMVTGRVIIDLLPILRSSNEDKYKFKSYTLKNVAKKLLKIEKLDVDPKEMRGLWENEGEDLKNFIEYSRRDAIITLDLLLEMKLVERYTEMAKASGSLLQDIANGGQSGMIENLLLRRFKSHDRVVPPKPDSETSDERFDDSESLKGGAVLDPEKGLVEDVIILDYKSLYPTLMMAYNICYSTISNSPEGEFEGVKAPMGGGEFVKTETLKGIVPEILEELLDKRIKIKKQMKLATGSQKELLDAEQYAIKILLNSFYGYSGYQRARLYDLRIANAVTSFGRENIKKTTDLINRMEKIDEYSFRVIYSDTDSVFIKVISKENKISLEKAEKLGDIIGKEITKNLPEPMELVYETFARRGILLAKKRYAMWIFEQNKEGYIDKLKIRGIETVRRDWCNLTSNTLKTCLDLILKEGKIAEAITLAKEKVDKLQNFNLTKDSSLLEDLIITKRYTKGAKAYKNKQPHIQLVERMKERGDTSPSIGDRVPFIIIKGKSGGKRQKDLFVNRAEDPNYIVKHEIQIDTEYYINKQLLPPLLRIFSTLKETSPVGEVSLIVKDKKQKTLEDW
jgi:DNA polymerase I